MNKAACYLILICTLFTLKSGAQTLNGLTTGNYAGISGLNFNPASIVDSRFKFDLNIAAAQFYYHNNYLDADPFIFARQLLRREPYNSSFAAVKADLLKPIEPTQTDRVRARQSTEFQLPLSFMLTTGKRSAIAINLRNRYEFTTDNLNPETAGMFYNELKDERLHGIPMNNDGFNNQFMNWQEVGFTYGRVLYNRNKHFFKGAVTAKWLGGNAASYIEADELEVTFQDPQTLSLTSPRIQYARTIRADIDLFSRRELFNNLEAQSLGWDVGVVYEFRGRIGNFRYTDEDYQSRLRRDKNKYTVRLGFALNDIGRLEYKSLPLARLHSANISNWNFGDVNANNFREWDTAYSQQISYTAGSDSNFSVSLPTAYIANVDLHLFGGFYVNAAMQRRLDWLQIGKPSTTTLYTGEWIAITPRFEGRFFGLYVPFMMRNNTTQIGATVRLGPLFVGSNNLMALIQNPMVPTADIHAGFRIPIGFGKPTKIARIFESSSGLKVTDSYEQELEKTKTKQSDLELRVALLEKMMDSSYRQPPTVIVNNYITDSMGTRAIQTQVNQEQQTKAATQTKTQPAQPTFTKEQVDSINAENEKLLKEVEARLKKEGIEPPKEPKAKKQKNAKVDKATANAAKNEKKAQQNSKKKLKSDKKIQKAEARYRQDKIKYDRAVQEELRRMRRQNAVTSTAIVGAITAGAVVSSNNIENIVQAIDTSRSTKTDTLIVEKVVRDTIFIRVVDTVIITPKDTIDRKAVKAPTIQTKYIDVPELRTARIFFASGSAVIGKNFTTVLNRAAGWMLQNPDKKVVVTGVTDATGSPQLNQKLAKQRVAAVIKALEIRGIDASRFEVEYEVSTIKTNQPSSTNRRVDLKAIQ
jgi:outer membrane protein OmpA-like peptidoglycan-associated protein